MRAALFSKDGSKRLAANPVNHIACTIRAFGAHAVELGNTPLTEMHFFYKNGRSAAFQLEDGGVVPIPTRFGDVHHELEICLLIGDTPLPSPLEPGAKFDPVAVKRSIAGIGLGLDWTLRDTQQPLAKQGLPWERSKSFERSAAFTPFLDVEGPEGKRPDMSSANPLFADGLDPAKFPRLRWTLIKNGEPVQQGDMAQISFCPLAQVWEMHKVTRLNPGDIVMTGTPTGVNSVKLGDKLGLLCEDLGIKCEVTVVDEAEVEQKKK